MNKEKKDNFIILLVWVVVIAIGIFIYIYGARPATPKVGIDGKISGDYAIQGIMNLGKPYICTFEKSDETSAISGKVHTDGKNIYGEFRINTPLVKTEFNSFLLIKDGVAYTWTSIQPIGYKYPVAKSTNGNASPEEQSQIIGLRDKLPYECELWQSADETLFEIPSFISFSEIKK